MADIPTYPFSYYKKLAATILKKYGLPVEKKLPVDIEVLLDKMGITIHSIPNMFKDFGVKGAVIKKAVGTGFDVSIDENQYETQEFYYRFTLAEELSHILLHEKLVAGITCLEEVQEFHRSFTDEQYKRIEQQARVMASQLLLPSHLFDDFILEWVKSHLSEIRKEKFYSTNELADYIACKIQASLKLSRDVVRTSIMRFPDSAIDKIIAVFGQDLIS